MAEQNTFSLLFFGIKNRANKQGEIPLHMRITVNKQKVEMALHRRVNISLWNPSVGLAMGNTKEARTINGFLLSVQTSIYDIYKYLRETGKPITPTSIKNAYLGIEPEEDKGKKVLELFREHNDKVKALVNIDYSPDTLERYETSLKHTRDFIMQKYDREDLYFSELDHEFIVDYEIYFKTVRKCAHNTTLKYIKNFKKIVRLAITTGHLDKDPFANFKMRLKKVDRGFLSDEELNILINKKFSINRLEQVRDCFVFSCFTGLAHSDLKRLSHEHIVTGTDGGNWIKIKRKKTDNLSSIPILDVTQKLLDKYKNNDECIANNVLLPVKSNQKMNAYLKEIADVCGIEKNFSSHLARHTFATTVTLNNNVPIETVSKMLGHSSINMTRIYARLLDKKVGQDMKHLNNKYKLSEVE
ncbi:MAG: site-specific integrase [Bacteroidales bacterium]|nr:site-specific integrase [Bacteroidales bacterium]